MRTAKAEWFATNRELGLISWEESKRTGRPADEYYYDWWCAININLIWASPTLRNDISSASILASPSDPEAEPFSAWESDSGVLQGFGYQEGIINPSGRARLQVSREVQSYALLMGGDALKPTSILAVTKNFLGEYRARPGEKTRFHTIPSNHGKPGIRWELIYKTYSPLRNKKEDIPLGRLLTHESINKTDAFGTPHVGFVGYDAKGTWKLENQRNLSITRKAMAQLRKGQGSILLSDGSVQMTSSDSGLQEAVQAHSRAKGGTHKYLVETLASPFSGNANVEP